ncbi:hypothetical protein GALMADRAFT_133125 [Galerina marginata CBS 339.88]|uniref:Uncharacterized protein n=1 Tax=Galerina marginata (strain CBS 339.88) TaxID=685588 RepID=A0A067TUU6_GALM3|nr:hypothetical protein GALMADRAFT_133125 [Galerina marginata CBS 339.88]
MSRLTASPFHKPSPFEFPRALPSPPETHSDTITGPAHITTSTYILAAQDPGLVPGLVDTGLAGTSPDTPSRARRSGSIPYHNTGFRETKERAAQRSGKSLIIVIPPPTLIQEHGQHPHTISSGPYHRLSQGVVMSLFPSMFAQLTAIAREFSFPSTSGICLYFHFVEGGLTFTPRITDDSWQGLWSHLSEHLLPNERRPVISGKVEFDIDLRLARWYPAWLSAILREFPENPTHYYPSTAPSLAHYRRESSLADSRQFEEDTVDNPAIHQHSAPIGRHVPRKLSLVERFDASSSARPDVKTNPRSVISPPDTILSSSHVLSTIVQEDEPKTAKQNLDTRVNSWRASAVLSPNPLAATGQTSLDPPNLPNNMPIDTPVETPSPVEEKMRLEDYTWSISSAGPQSCDYASPTSWSDAHSVHVANRLEGSVCASPSVCTSFGPLDDDFDLYFASTNSIVPSPDVAHRFYEDSPPTPLTATSWGAPLSYPPSPRYKYVSIPSPDLAQRFYEDSPPTPMTATSWGAPLSYPPSPRCVSPAPSLDIGERTRHEETASPVGLSRSPWLHTWPYNSEHYQASTSFDRKPWSHVWPYGAVRSQELSDMPWPLAWPYTSERYKATAGPNGTPPGGNPWPYVWPYNNDRPKTPSGMPWSHVWPYISQQFVQDTPSIAVKLPAEYPMFDLYAAVYPHNLEDIYPAPLSLPGSKLWPDPSRRSAQDTLSSIGVRLPAEYPTVELYTAVYPHNLDNIYPAIVRSHVDNTQLQEGYPFFDIYPPTSAPYFGHFSLHTCNPHSQYPSFDIYPEVRTPSKPTSVELPSKFLPLQKYPVLNIYPAVYPHFDIYPSVEQEIQTKLGRQSLRTSLDVTYPFFSLYPAVYPHFDLYPFIHEDFNQGAQQSDSATMLLLSVVVPPAYPFFNLYPAIYPHLDIYPTFYSSVHGKADEASERTLTPALGLIYPYFNLYPGVYPHLDLYPAPYGLLPKADEHDGRSLTPTLALAYPYFNLYPRVYPHLEIYPAPYFSKTSAASYSIAVYPHFYLYPTIETRSGDTHAKPTSNRTDAQYPFFDLYPAVYPYFDLYLPLPELFLTQPKKAKSSSRLTHLELHAMAMMERQRPFGPGDSVPGLQETGPTVRSQLSLINEDEEISHYLQETSASNTARNIRLSSVPRSRDSQAAYKSGSAIFLPDPANTVHPFNSLSLRRSTNSPEREISTSAGLREHQSSRASIGLPPKLGPSRRDSLVLQRVKAFDHNGEFFNLLLEYFLTSSDQQKPKQDSPKRH